MNAAEAHWVARFDNSGAWTPLWLGLSVAFIYLLLHCAIDGLFLAIWGFPEGLEPLWRDPIRWSDLVNATLLGYIPAVLLIAHRGIDRDLGQLRPWLPQDGNHFDDIRTSAIRPAGFAGRAFKFSGLLLGVAAVFIDPSISLGSERSLTNPVFMWALLQTPLFIWLVFSLIVADLNATRTYLHVGRNLVEVDLLDIYTLAPFARRGLRSSLTWMIFLMIFSLFWVAESAAMGNPLLFGTVLAMATAAFVVPLIGVHQNILTEKQSALDRLREEIRVERGPGIEDLSDKSSTSPRLANLIAYYQLIDGAREWPVNAANLLRFFMYLLIGLGSWLGGAVVERLLDSTLGG